MSDPLLTLRGVKTYYGNVIALKGVDVDVREGEIVALIGANGAGKSTLMMTVFGDPRAREGEIRFAGRDITAMPTHEIAKLRIAQSPEGRRIFPRMTVLDNLRMGAYVRSDSEVGRDIDSVFVRFPVLAERRDQMAGTLSGGEQQMLAIGRALVARPRLLLLDEPSLGLAPKFVTRIFLTLRELRQEGKTILLVEQNARQALQVADRGYVMERGRIVLTGSGAELLSTPEVRQTYLGQSAA